MSTWKINVVQPPVNTAPIGHPPTWEAVLNRCGGRCECTGSCGRTHSRTEFRCDRTHDRGGVRITVAPAHLVVTGAAAARLPVAELRAWCPDCYRMARRRHIDADAARTRFEPTTDAPTLFDL